MREFVSSTPEEFFFREYPLPDLSTRLCQSCSAEGGTRPCFRLLRRGKCHKDNCSFCHNRDGHKIKKKKNPLGSSKKSRSSQNDELRIVAEDVARSSNEQEPDRIPPDSETELRLATDIAAAGTHRDMLDMTESSSPELASNATNQQANAIVANDAAAVAPFIARWHLFLCIAVIFAVGCCVASFAYDSRIASSVHNVTVGDATYSCGATEYWGVRRRKLKFIQKQCDRLRGVTWFQWYTLCWTMLLFALGVMVSPIARNFSWAGKFAAIGFLAVMTLKVMAQIVKPFAMSMYAIHVGGGKVDANTIVASVQSFSSTSFFGMHAVLGMIFMTLIGALLNIQW